MAPGATRFRGQLLKAVGSSPTLGLRRAQALHDPDSPRSRRWLAITLAALLCPVVTSLLATESPATTALRNHSIHIHTKHVIQHRDTVTVLRPEATTMTHDDGDAGVPATHTPAALLRPVVTSLLITESPATTTLHNHSIHIQTKHGPASRGHKNDS
jgi:hypothetical protein